MSVLTGHSRRAFLARAARLGAALPIAGLAASLAPSLSVDAQAAPRRVLIEDLLDPRAQRAASNAHTLTGSGTLTAGRPFTHVGLHWQGPASVPVEVQTSADGSAWTPWRAVAVESHQRDRSSAQQETFAALLGAPRHQVVRYRFPDSLAQAVGDVTATCLNVLDGPPLASPLQAAGGLQLAWAPPAHADGADFRTGVITREQWGADESLRFSPTTGADMWVRAYVAPRMVVVHHTATDTAYIDAAAEVRAIYVYHTVTQGFGDIGYHAIVDRDGHIYEGRLGRETDPFGRFERDVLSHSVVAGHALAHNYGSVGVGLLGNYHEPGSEPTEPMLRRLEDLLVFEHGRHQVDPHGQVDFARSNRLWRYGLPGLAGHRDCNNTECPGDAVYRLLGDLRERVAARLGAPPLPVDAIRAAPAERNPWLGRDGATAAFAWSGRAPFDCVFEGFQRELGQDPVTHRLGYNAQGLPEHLVTPQRDATFRLTESGQYTLHLRPADGPFADRRTILLDRHVVRDNADAEGVEREGAWSRSREILDLFGDDYEVAEPDADARFTWTLQAPDGGTFTVQACWPASPDRSKAASYQFGPDDEPALTATVDQTLDSGTWIDLGTVDLASGQACRVTLSAAPDGTVSADAVRLVLPG